MISVLISTLDESPEGLLPKILTSLQKDWVSEILISEGDPQGTTQEIAQNFPKTQLHVCPSSSRGARFHFIAQKAQGDYFLLHHPRSLLDQTALEELRHIPKNFAWGAFVHEFSPLPQKKLDRALLQWTSWYSNHVRGGMRGVFYLDHCLLVKRELYFQIGGMPAIDIFEDTVFSRALTAQAKAWRFQGKSQTSPQRFLERGAWRRSLENQLLKLGFALGINHQRLNRWYEGRKGLNSRYPSSPKKSL